MKLLNKLFENAGMDYGIATLIVLAYLSLL